MQKKILFRADGNSKTGLGHLYRVLAIMEMLKENFECLLLTKEESPSEILTAYKHQRIPKNINITDEPLWMEKNFSSNEHEIVLDGYQFDETYQKELKNKGYKLTYVDDLKKEPVYADTIINHSLQVKQSDYKNAAQTRLALGPKYTMLRTAFMDAATQAREIKEIKTAFVCLGGADPNDLTFKFTEALLRFTQIKKINIVLGAAYKHTQIKELQKKHSSIHLHQQLSDKEMISVMKDSDMGIVPASTTLYEVCCVKMPICCGYSADNQKDIYSGALAHGIIFGAGNIQEGTSEQLEKKLNEFFNSVSIQDQIKAQSKLFDTKIKQRFNILFSEINYRKADLNDLNITFNWSNEKETRANSYETEPILFETHQSWFSKKINDPHSAIYIAQVKGQAAGMVRFEDKTDHSVVGVVLDPAYRGFDLASVFLKEATVLYTQENNKPVHAYIKQTNSSSARAFEKAGFKKTEELIVKGAPSSLYVL